MSSEFDMSDFSVDYDTLALVDNIELESIKPIKTVKTTRSSSLSPPPSSQIPTQEPVLSGNITLESEPEDFWNDAAETNLAIPGDSSIIIPDSETDGDVFLKPALPVRNTKVGLSLTSPMSKIQSPKSINQRPPVKSFWGNPRNFNRIQNSPVQKSSTDSFAMSFERSQQVQSYKEKRQKRPIFILSSPITNSPDSRHSKTTNAEAGPSKIRRTSIESLDEDSSVIIVTPRTKTIVQDSDEEESIKIDEHRRRIRKGKARRVAYSSDEERTENASKAKGRDLDDGPTTSPKRLRKYLPRSSPSPPPNRKKRPRLIPLTVKEAGRSRLFDMEAVNSDVSHSEASTEEYDSENSIDRDFLDHGQEEETEADASQEGRFRLESLMSQRAPALGFSGGIARLGGYKFANLADYADQSQMTQVEPDEWSYDSFVVPDDEPIEMENDESSDF